jgi:hypothetical protein
MLEAGVSLNPDPFITTGVPIGAETGANEVITGWAKRCSENKILTKRWKGFVFKQLVLVIDEVVSHKIIKYNPVYNW